tara:strand:- start:627 stop:740 length:114 start_codon:yes stop_codon:yes gene_type:complete
LAQVGLLGPQETLVMMGLILFLKISQQLAVAVVVKVR